MVSGTKILLALLVGMSLFVSPFGLVYNAFSEPIKIFFVRHVDTQDAQLTDLGRQEAQKLANVLSLTKLTHIYSSHQSRNYQTVQPTAKSQGLEVVQIPKPGSMLNGKKVLDYTSEDAAIPGLVAALQQLPSGSTALVCGNPPNLFAIMAALGVRIATSSTPCIKGQSCLRCADDSCFPTFESTRLWLLIHPSKDAGNKPVLVTLEYGN